MGAPGKVNVAVPVSPEQATGQEGDARSDVYSWGIVMYELLTGRVPFTGPDPPSAIRARLTETPAALVRARPEIPRLLNRIVTKAMRRFPEQRYANGDELLADLDRLDDPRFDELYRRDDDPVVDPPQEDPR